MKTLPTALAQHLASGVTTLCYCWRLTRTDATVSGFTDHDRDLLAVGTTFLASTGFTASRIEQSLGLAVDNLEAAGALSALGLGEADILAGRYDGAGVDLFLVNWADPTQALLLSTGTLGDIRREGIAFSAELRSLSSRLNQKIGSAYTRTCSAVLGDARCKVDLSQPAFRGAAVATSAGKCRAVDVSGLSGFASDWFSGGTLTFATGANATIPFEIKAHRRTAGIDIVEFWLPPPFPVALGDSGTVVAGCRKTLAVCRQKFDNVANFRGFPHIPGTDVITRYGVEGALGQSGGSIFGNGG